MDNEQVVRIADALANIENQLFGLNEWLVQYGETRLAPPLPSPGIHLVRIRSQWSEEVLAHGGALAEEMRAGGLELGSLGARVKRPANSGIKASGAGVEIVPLPVGAKTTGVNVGDGHSHPGLAFADGKANPGELAKTTAEGDYTLRYLTGDKVRTPLVDTAAGGHRGAMGRPRRPDGRSVRPDG